MRTYAIFLGLLITSAAFGQAYRWVDSDGVVHYSDRPVAGAESIELATRGRGSAPATAESAAAAAETPTRTATRATSGAAATPVQPASTSYRSLEIVRPQQGESLWNIGGTLRVSLRLSPGLADGDRIRLIYDGAEVTGTPRGPLDIRLDEVNRGQHTIQAEVLSPSNELLIQSESNTFYVQQTSIIKPR